MRRRKSPSRRGAYRSGKPAGGFTLLEVLVAMAILSSVLTLCYRVMTDAIAAEARSEHWTMAACLGEAILREATATFPAVGETSGRFPPPDDAYSWDRAVRQAPHSDAVEVRVTIKWNEKDGEEKIELAGIAVK